MLTVERIDAPRSVYVADGFGSRFPVAIPLQGSVSVNAQELVKKVIKDKGPMALNPLIKSMASTIAPLNGGDPNKIANALIKYQRGGEQYPDPIEGYRGYFLNHAEDDYNKFLTAVEDTKRLDDWTCAAQAHALLLRIPNLAELHGAKWKTEDALNSEIMTPGILVQFSNLYNLELGLADISEYTNDKNEFTWKPKKPASAPAVPAEQESVEVLAGK